MCVCTYVCTVHTKGEVKVCGYHQLQAFPQCTHEWGEGGGDNIRSTT